MSSISNSGPSSGVGLTRPLSPNLEDSVSVEVRDLGVHFEMRGGLGRRSQGLIRAVDGVSLSIGRGKTYGLVGESGSGKSTLGRALVGLQPPTYGRVVVDGRDVYPASSRVRAVRDIQIVFQDPYSSLNPRMTVKGIIAESLRTGKDAGYLRSTRSEMEDHIEAILELVGLPGASMQKYPHQFSGGQRQRIAIARALAPGPSVIILDEPTSSLDVSVRAQIVNLLRDLQGRLGVAYLFISHDLLTVAHVSEVIGVMYLGKLVESGSVEAVYKRPGHPYTQRLLASIPGQERFDVPDAASFGGEIPSALAIPSGCRYRTRCALRTELGDPEECSISDPALMMIESEHMAACHFVTKQE